MNKHILFLLIVILFTSCDKKGNEKVEEIKKVDTYSSQDYEKRDENHPDAKVIKQMELAGSDLKKPHEPDFKFEFKEEKSAKLITNILEKKGFKVELFLPTEKFPTYGIKAVKEMIIDFKTIADLNDEFRKLAKENNGEFLGWGAPVVK